MIEDVVSKFTDELNSACAHENQNIINCVDCLVEKYNNLLKEDYDSRCPLIHKEIVVKENSPWFNGEILNMKRDKRRKEQRWHRLKTNNAYEEFKQAKNRYIYHIKIRKAEFYRQKIREAGSCMNKLYKILNNLTGKNNKKILPDGQNNQDLANAFSDFFENKIRTLTMSFSDHSEIRLPHVDVNPPHENLDHFEQIDKNKLVNLFRKAKKTHCSLDPIPMSNLVDAENFTMFLDIVLEIVNKSISLCKFPAKLKHAVIHPAIKGTQDPQSLSSYRPISNLPFFSKILEYTILDQLQSHLDENKIIPDKQSAYRRLYSTETTICSVVNDLLALMDEGKCGLLVLLDLSAAFDTVVHKLLLKDLRDAGVVGDALKYIENYLIDRKYCVQIGDSFSQEKPLERGVPQGSILGPILFCIYTIGLAKMLQGLGVEFKLFADDTQLYMCITDIDSVTERLNHVLSNVKKWMDFKHLKLNENKTEYMVVGKKECLRNLNVNNIIINGNQVQIANKVKDLGVQIDCNLTLNSQINNVVRVAGFHLRNIAFVKKYIDEDSVKKLIVNYVISRIDQCNSIYYGLPKYQLRKLQKILNRAARLVKGQSPRDRITPVLIDLHWLPIKARIKFKICVLTHQVVKTGRPEYLRKQIDVIQPSEYINTRSAISGVTLSRQRVRTNIGSRTFTAAAPILYNSIPIEIRKIDDLKSFKLKLKTFLFADCYDLRDRTINDQYKV